MILAGDIGGTNCRLAFYDDQLSIVAERNYHSREYVALEPVLDRLIADTGLRPDRVCFGVAGPVRNGVSKTTNLPWIVDARELARHLGLPSAVLINDLEANAYGILALPAQDFFILNAGAPDAAGNQAVLAPGTGLGEAGLFWDGQRHHPFACEGGHSGFTPRSEQELILLRYLFQQHRYPDIEHLISGPGLYTIYRFLRDTGRGQELDWLREEMKHHDPPACITRAALEEKCPMSVAAVDMFVSIAGTECANLALKVMATGGVYLGGGIIPRILPKFQGPRFLEAFFTTGSMRKLLEAMPVRVVLNTRTALLGAAVYARGGGPA